MNEKDHFGEHNYLKFKILDAVRFEHLTAFEIAMLTNPSIPMKTPEFKLIYQKTLTTVGRLSKKYDPNLSVTNRGYSIPYLSRRWIGSEGGQKERHGRYEFRATQKGRRLLCEWLYRIELGHSDLKWTGNYFNPMIKTCGVKCDTCSECTG